MVVTTNFSSREMLTYNELSIGKYYKIVAADPDAGWKVGDVVYMPLGRLPSYPNNLNTGQYTTEDFDGIRYQLLEPGDSFTVTI